VSRPARVVLVGFMGAGKSTVGPEVARALDFRFRDLDQALERRLGLTVPELFRTRGEAAFRAEELAEARAAAALERHVIAAGGGAFAQDQTREVLRAGAFSVWLRCGLATVLARVPPDGSRPLALDRATIEALFVQRESSYRQADRVVDAEQEPAEVARDVVMAYLTLPDEQG
jgi:shikimate kinase